MAAFRARANTRRVGFTPGQLMHQPAGILTDFVTDPIFGKKK